MEDKNYLTEAFKAFDDLTEDVFDISVNDGIEKAKEFIEEPVDELEIIYDPLATEEEEIKDSYLGKAILQCEICQSMLYKDPSEVVINEEMGLANLDEACPYCQSEEGFKVIGQVAEYCGDCKDENHKEDIEEKEDIEVEESLKNIIKESLQNDEDKFDLVSTLYEKVAPIFRVYTKKGVSLKDAENALEMVLMHLEDDETIDWSDLEERFKEALKSIKRDDIDADADDKKEVAKKAFGRKKDDADADRDYKLNKANLKEEDKPAAISIEDAQKWVDYDMKKYGKISERTNRLVKKAGFQILKDDHGDYEVAAGKFESCNEEFEKVQVETEGEKITVESDENEKVTVTTEPKEEVHEEKAEVIEPVSDEVKTDFKTEDEFQDIDIDEFDEEEFDQLGEQYLKRVYENVKSFKTTNGSVKGNNLKLEGIITFKSGKEAKTNFIFEAATITKTGKMKFIGENKQFAKGKKSFTLTGKMDGKKLVCESFNYNYIAKDNNGKSKRLYGTINR